MKLMKPERGCALPRALFLLHHYQHKQVMEGEDAIVESMRRFANDAKCVEYLKTFKDAWKQLKRRFGSVILQSLVLVRPVDVGVGAASNVWPGL